MWSQGQVGVVSQGQVGVVSQGQVGVVSQGQVGVVSGSGGCGLSGGCVGSLHRRYVI